MVPCFLTSNLLHQTKLHLFNISDWGPWCDVILTLKQALQSDNGAKIFLDEHQCKRAFRHFMTLLNRAVYGNTVKLHGKRLRGLSVVEKGEQGRGTWGRWHIHCAIELPQHLDAIAFEHLIQDCWEKVHWAQSRVLVRDGADKGWIDYMLKLRQKAYFDNLLDCIDLDSLHNPIADA